MGQLMGLGGKGVSSKLLWNNPNTTLGTTTFDFAIDEFDYIKIFYGTVANVIISVETLKAAKSSSGVTYGVIDADSYANSRQVRITSANKLYISIATFVNYDNGDVRTATNAIPPIEIYGIKGKI